MTTQEFIFNVPLYTKIDISEDDQILMDLCAYELRVDGYNPIVGVDSTYRLVYGLDSQFINVENVKEIRFDCQRYGQSLIVYVHYNAPEGYMEKVGQYPSVADIAIAQIKQYNKVLGKQYLRDFTKAIGLAANGVGTGSYVYLRRIFEHLVDEMSKRAIKNGEIDEPAFNASKMDKKLKMIENHLPEVMKDNKPLYGVLSKGIHELTEDECLKYFSIVRQVIELILDELEYERQKEVKKKHAHDQLAQIAGAIKK